MVYNVGFQNFSTVRETCRRGRDSQCDREMSAPSKLATLLVNIEREIAEKYDYEDFLPHFTGAKRRRADLE